MSQDAKSEFYIPTTIKVYSGTRTMLKELAAKNRVTMMVMLWRIVQEAYKKSILEK